jgi:hypothetical protein
VKSLKVVKAATIRLAVVVLALSMAPTVARAQSRPWIVVGGASTTLLGDCTDCAADTYLHSGSLLADGGFSINPRTDLAAEFFWTPQTLTTGEEIRVSYLMASVQFRPWQSHGFFLKAGSGMAFLKNWLDAFDTSNPPIRSKAFALALGTGWEWRVRQRFGVQVFGAQHVAALGDLETSTRKVENVMGNLWSVGAAVVIR